MLISYSGFSQRLTAPTTEAVNYLERSVWRLTVLAPGILNESRIGPKSGVMASRGLSIGRGTISLNFSPYINTYVSVGGRYFYNLSRRYVKGKSTKFNSANYLMIRTNYTFPPFLIDYEPRITIGVLQGLSVNALWGIQRTFQSNIYLNFATGVKIAPNGYGLAGNFIVGYTFLNKKGPRY
ncbi:hypothetical protein IC230_27400 [Spirosoma sp. BT704]|uniref:DUF3575 domain-containing protein n=1 Tax=Spirosoma validum TaxID=2771355 RepID=A0A927GGI3_9BACT|nr:hypothetical protein [Spirosoma validum]